MEKIKEKKSSKKVFLEIKVSICALALRQFKAMVPDEYKILFYVYAKRKTEFFMILILKNILIILITFFVYNLWSISFSYSDKKLSAIAFNYHKRIKTK